MKKTIRTFIFFIISASLSACFVSPKKRIEWKEYDESKHFTATLTQGQIDTLKTWDFCWANVQPILKMMGTHGDWEVDNLKKLAPAQKALFFFWNLDAEVTSGGFIQFYWNGLDYQVEPLIAGLELVGDKDLVKLIKKADAEYKKNEKLFEECRKKGDLHRLYAELKELKSYRTEYENLQNNSVALMESYIRKNSKDFFLKK
jgi:hypothetical protein